MSGPNPGDKAPAFSMKTDGNGAVVGATTTDGDGHYYFGELRSGGYTLVVTAAGHRPSARTLMVTDAGETEADVEISCSAAMFGVARGVHGRPVPDARVTLVDPAGVVVAMTTTDESGEYAFAELPEGEYTVIASGYPPVSSRRSVKAGVDEVHDVLLEHSEL